MQWSEATHTHAKHARARALKAQGERVEPVQLLKARKELERILVRVIILAVRQSRGADINSESITGFMGTSRQAKYAITITPR